MASNAELHLFICLLQFMDLDYADYPGTVAKCILVVDINTKYLKVHTNCESNIYRSVGKIQQ